jgi:hypothetical protein
MVRKNSFHGLDRSTSGASVYPTIVTYVRYEGAITVMMQRIA